MANLIEYTPVSNTELMADINRFKFNPQLIQRTILDKLAKTTENKVDIVDPTNPFVFLLDAAAYASASAVMESEINLRKQYPIIAQDESQIYPHMSDKDFITRFASPVSAEFHIMISYHELLQNLVDNPTEDCKMVTIPRDTYIEVGGVRFTLHYPINIRLYYTNILEVSYDNSIIHPLHSLSTNIIKHEFRQDASGVTWLDFVVDTTQYTVESTQHTLMESVPFKQTLPLKEHYFYARVYYQNDLTGRQWREMRTTHTDQTFDHRKPTAILTVVDQTLTVYIPPIYTRSQLVSGVLRIDIYTTKGIVSIDFSNYKIGEYVMKLEPIDEPRDVSVYTNAMLSIPSYYAVSYNVVNGGRRPLSFLELKDRVIDNAFGDNKLPITNVQLDANLHFKGFELVKNVDVLTNRIYLATRALPAPLNENLITAASMTIETLTTNLADLRENPYVAYNGDRCTIMSEAMYVLNNGIVEFYPKSTLETIQSLTGTTFVDIVNQIDFLYSPYYYVLDNSMEEFELRAYHLDDPSLSAFSFVAQNHKSELTVNTEFYSIEKIPEGYRLRLQTVGSQFYRKLNDQYVHVQIAFKPPGEDRYGYLNGTIVGKTDSGDRVFEFILKSNHDIDSLDRMGFTNFAMFTAESLLLTTNMSQDFMILYSTSSVPINYTTDGLDSLLGRFLLPRNSIAITRETITLNLGQRLKHLWSQSRSAIAGGDYAVYTTDIPKVYDKDIYEIDPTTGSIFDSDMNYTKLHSRGDVVYDSDGEVVYEHRKGDIYLVDGKPVPTTELTTARYLDMLFIDGRYRFANDEKYRLYLREIRRMIREWITVSLEDVSQYLLEQTRIFYYPYKSTGKIDVLISDRDIVRISADQSFKLDLFVPTLVYNDYRVRSELERIAILTLDEKIKSRTISMSDITATLKEKFGSSVISFRISGLGGDKNYETVTLLKASDSLSLRKRLVDLEDTTFYVEEAVEFNFIRYQER